jgi:FRG domain
MTEDRPKGGQVAVAGSWRELDDLLFEGAWNPRVRRFRSLNAFRGVGRRGLDLRTGVMRLGGEPGAKERHLVRNFRKYARRSFVGDDSIWNWLSLAQHHGLPTRLLDWSYSPYVALHFATADAYDHEEEGEVWVVSLPEVNRDLPAPLGGLLEEEGSHVFTGEMLSSVAATLAHLDRLAPAPFALFLEPPALSERIVNQAALFSLMSSSTARFDEWLRDRPAAWRRVVIPARLRREVRDRLDQVNLTERVLMPGLDGLSQWLARYYRESARGPE